MDGWESEQMDGEVRGWEWTHSSIFSEGRCEVIQYTVGPRTRTGPGT